MAGFFGIPAEAAVSANVNVRKSERGDKAELIGDATNNNIANNDVVALDDAKEEGADDVVIFMEDIDAAGSDEDPMIGADDDDDADTTHIRGTSPLEATRCCLLFIKHQYNSSIYQFVLQ